MCIRDLCIIITTNWEVYLHIWMVTRVGLMRLQQGSPFEGYEQRGRESPRVMNVDLRTWGQRTRLAPGKMPASLGQASDEKTPPLAVGSSL